MAKHPKVFSELYCSLVEAGEAGGVLDKTLDVAAIQFDKEAELRERVKAAMTFPFIVLVAAMGVVAFMLLAIVPTFAKVYVQFKALIFCFVPFKIRTVNKINLINILAIAGFIAFLVAMADEIRQAYIPGRDASIIDVLLDTIGILSVLILYFYLKKRRYRKTFFPIKP